MPIPASGRPLWRVGAMKRKILCAAVLAAILAVPSPANAGITRPSLAPDGPTDFFSSFEPGDPQPTWTDTVETDARGVKKSSGVTGTSFIAVPGSVTDQVTALAVSGENTAGGEVRAKLIDSDVLTKWLVFAPAAFIECTLAQPVAVQRYALSSANDEPARDPRDWTLSGSTDGQTWTPLDSRTGQVFAERYQTNTYDFVNKSAYQHYRLDITHNGGAPIVQLAEVQLSDGSDRQPPPTDMKSSVGTGPAESANAMMNAGWTGLKALQYAGSVVANGRGYSYNKVFDVNVHVTTTSELSYLIFPEFTQGNLRYPSTYASVDLAFDDVTYLSDLKATDQHNRGLSPTAQGDSKTLYAGQWNHKQARLGDVAAGTTVQRILVGYDNPTGPA